MGNLEHNNILVTGGGGLLGLEHAVAISSASGLPILLDVNTEALDKNRELFEQRLPGSRIEIFTGDVTDRENLLKLRDVIENDIGAIHCLVNNAAINPSMDNGTTAPPTAFEDYPVDDWNHELSVGLTGAFLASQVFGQSMAERGGGNIVNIASDLAVIGPDHRIYDASRDMDKVQSFKPVSYAVCKTALIGLTRYIATYWAHRGVRCNALAPGGVYTGQNVTLVSGLEDRIPMRRMANKDEYHGAIVYLCSDASSYMTGQVMVVDGGRSVW